MDSGEFFLPISFMLYGMLVDEESCYKTVETSKGPLLVLSVSTTFLKLKDLILEKKSLQKELDSFKVLKSNILSKVFSRNKNYLN